MVKRMDKDWIRCPVCGSKTRDKIRADTEMKNFPVFCPKCKREILIDVEQFQITVIHEPAAKPQSR
ncbi:cysteine-rich KTR domain-containing protein [Petralouisia muris]|jgi:DNA-directed RNA polymerase subunit RPC12/RpoP